jgi:hypothetical protein
MASTTYIQFNASPTYSVRVRINGARVVFFNKGSYLDLAFDIQFLNKVTSTWCPLFNEGALPDRLFENLHDVEALIGDNLLNQLLYALLK